MFSKTLVEYVHAMRVLSPILLLWLGARFHFVGFYQFKHAKRILQWSLLPVAYGLSSAPSSRSSFHSNSCILLANRKTHPNCTSHLTDQPDEWNASIPVGRHIESYALPFVFFSLCVVCVCVIPSTDFIPLFRQNRNTVMLKLVSSTHATSWLQLSCPWWMVSCDPNILADKIYSVYSVIVAI